MKSSTGAYLLTQKNNFYTIEETMKIMNAFIDTHVDLPEPAIIKVIIIIYSDLNLLIN